MCTCIFVGSYDIPSTTSMFQFVCVFDFKLKDLATIKQADSTWEINHINPKKEECLSGTQISRIFLHRSSVT